MNYYSHGKLLITAEYAVLDGAQALCIPTNSGQSLSVEKTGSGLVSWVSREKDGSVWFEETFEKTNTGIRGTTSGISTEHDQISRRLIQILEQAQKQSGMDLFYGYRLVSDLEFDRQWGLGTSSTLLNNISQWLGIDGYQLLESTFKGSGYDIACAGASTPITYQVQNNTRSILQVAFDPPFKDSIYFVYLNRKQNSREAIAHYRKQPISDKQRLTDKISGITQQLLQCETLSEFEILLDIHETLISKAVDLPKVKKKYFPDFPGSIKSLGGWGGDFVMATGDPASQEYFRSRGYTTIISFQEMLFQSV